MKYFPTNHGLPLYTSEGIKSDVCLVLEGTYPETLGGISSWVDDLITQLPRIRFSIARVGTLSSPESWKFSPPPNLHALHEVADPGPLDFRDIKSLERWSHSQSGKFPLACIYHAIGTGLGALLASSAASQSKKDAKFLLSEHASYVREIALGSVCLESGQSLPDTISERHHLMGLFRKVAETSYRRADAVTALDASTHHTQIRSGAPPFKCSVIPNGVSLRPRSIPPEGGFHVAYVGRINPLKGTDIFIEAAQLSSRRVQDLSFSILGPADCAVKYEAYCRAQARLLGNQLSWLGPRPRNDWGCEPHCVVLSSRREAQPFTILEAFARGIPVIAPDVGGCRDMISGDRSSGPAGIVVQSSKPDLIARGIETLARNPKMAINMGNEGRKKARTRYSRKAMVSSFEQKYRALTSQERRIECG